MEGQNVQYGQSMSQNLYRLFTEAEKIREALKTTTYLQRVVVLTLMELQNHPLTRYLVQHHVTKEN